MDLAEPVVPMVHLVQVVRLGQAVHLVQAVQVDLVDLLVHPEFLVQMVLKEQVVKVVLQDPAV